VDLPTHFFFGIAVALVFFGKPEVALLVGMGALLPDLDREYWYVKPQKYADEQYQGKISQCIRYFSCLPG
jgi:hypothetical protein